MNSQKRPVRSGTQGGISFIGLLFVAIVLGSLVLVGMRVFPTYMEYIAIGKAVDKASGDGATVADIRRSFDRSAEVEDIHSITGKDLEVSKEGEKVVVTYAYDVELNLVGPMYLLIKYSGRSK